VSLLPSPLSANVNPKSHRLRAWAIPFASRYTYAKVFGINSSAIMQFAEELDDPIYVFPPLLTEKQIKGLEGRETLVPRIRKLKGKP